MNPNFKSLHHFIRNAATNIKHTTSTFMLQKVEGEYREITYSETFENLNAISAYFLKMGLEKGDRVAVMMENCPEYVYFDQAMMQLGVAIVAIYPSLTDKEVEYIINDSGAKAILVGNKFLLKKVLNVKENCPELKTILTNFEPQPENKSKVIELTTVVNEGKTLYGELHNQIEERFHSVDRFDLASLIYTSGTTGEPKGVMLTHDNFMSDAIIAIKLAPQVVSTDRFLSFLPLCHVYERMIACYLSTYIGAEVAFAQSIETIATNLAEVNPTIMTTVPRLLERVKERTTKKVATGSPTGRAIFNWAVKTGERYRLKKEADKIIGPWLHLKRFIADKLVFSKIKAKLGGRMRLIISGGGALPVHVAEFFGNIGVRVMEGYGLTETSPFISVNEYNRQVIGTVGRVGPLLKVAIQNIETGEIITEQSYDSYYPEFESEEGEILVKGPIVMKGYWNKPEETAAVFDNDGWFHTGDVGKFYKGYLKITDRIKNLLVNAYGKNIYPTPVENTYLQSPKIEQVFLIGDKQEFMTAIITLNQENAIEQLKLNEQFFEEGSEFIEDDIIKKWVSEDIKKFSEELAKFERIKTFLIRRRPFSQDTGEMTPTLKIKRRVVEEMYSKEIAAMYPQQASAS